MKRWMIVLVVIVTSISLVLALPQGSSKRKKKKKVKAASAIVLKGEWRIVSVNTGEKLDSLVENQAFFGFDTAGQLYGNSGCNNFMGKHHQMGDSLYLEVVGMTKMNCRGEAGKTEYRFRELYPQVKKLRKLGDEVFLSGDSGDLFRLRKI